MKKVTLLILSFFLSSIVFPCTNFIVTKGASADGSTFLAYTNDGEWIYHLDKTPAKNHKFGDSLEFSGRFGAKGKIHQVSHTYAVIGFQMNEHQVAVGETTFVGREELWNKSKYLEYWHLMRLALERAKTAREAIKIMTELVEQYGYGSEGESFSIADPNEAWILEMIGTGDGGEGAVWVAVKIPDGYISAHANMARIGEFSLDDPENCLYSANIISFAVENGYYDTDSGEPFRFNEAYCPSTPERLKYCESRVWSLFNRAAPSKNLSSDYCRGVKNTERYPLFIKPDKKIKLENVMDLIRDHYEGTDFDMTKGIDAGPFGSPSRWGPLSWENDSLKYSWERPISIFNSAFSYIAQLRSWLPNELGGIAWFGVDDTFFSCYFPVYCGVTEISEPFTKGDIRNFSWESAWWTFNFVSNFSNLKYSYMKKDIQKVQHKLESKFISDQDSITEIALNLNEEERIKFLTEYSCNQGKLAHKEWVELAEFLIMKYNDGYLKNENGKITSPGYPDEWKQQMINIYPEKFNINRNR
ncbi:MAG: C69 family dipeptidase [Bacteroidales bacterium]|nr:C69 family dipeptidase [Bacteroidales bacterium]